MGCVGLSGSVNPTVWSPHHFLPLGQVCVRTSALLAYQCRSACRCPGAVLQPLCCAYQVHVSCYSCTTCHDVLGCFWLLVAHSADICVALLHDMFGEVSGLQCLVLGCHDEAFSLSFESRVLHPLERLVHVYVWVIQVFGELSHACASHTTLFSFPSGSLPCTCF